jgi:hypothetical protein
LHPAGIHGNLGRNTLTGPGIAQFDLSMVKNFGFWGSRRLEFRLAFFNLFNRANYGAPTLDAFTDATGTPNPAFGRINTTSTTPRQGQIVLKVIF